MGSEVAISELMGSLDQAVREVGDMETKLEVYDQLLSGVRTTMARLGGQYAAILLESRNLQALLEEVDGLVVSWPLVAASRSAPLLPPLRPSWTWIPVWSTLY